VVGTGVGVLVGCVVGCGVGVGPGLGVIVGCGVEVGSGLGMAVGCAVGVGSGLGVAVGCGVAVGAGLGGSPGTGLALGVGTLTGGGPSPGAVGVSPPPPQAARAKKVVQRTLRRKTLCANISFMTIFPDYSLCFLHAVTRGVQVRTTRSKAFCGCPVRFPDACDREPSSRARHQRCVLDQDVWPCVRVRGVCLGAR
jgi:hypothetical protein